VEQAPVVELFKTPKHPYTIALIGSTPILGHADKPLTTIPGSVPNLVDLPSGCKFWPRCVARVEHGLEICLTEEPELKPIGPNQTVRCWLYE